LITKPLLRPRRQSGARGTPIAECERH